MTHVNTKWVKVSVCPKVLSNAIWFEDARINRLSTCTKCNPENRCVKCLRRFTGEVFLIHDVKKDVVTKALKKLDTIPVENLADALTYIGIPAQFEIFNQKRIRYLEKKYLTNINIYRRGDLTNINRHHRKKNYETIVVREPKISEDKKFKTTLNLMLNEAYPDTLNGLIENFDVINAVHLLPTIYRCNKTKKCKFSTRIKYVYDSHILICENFNKHKVKVTQISYGDNKSVLDEIVV